ncbi:MAG: DUF4372 domain-containing protein, partial [Acidobacteriaceae bacterium]
MLFCQLAGAQSLREICGGLAASEGKLRHLGLPGAPRALSSCICCSIIRDCCPAMPSSPKAARMKAASPARCAL